MRMIDFLRDYGEAVEEQKEINQKIKSNQRRAYPKRRR